MSLQMKKEWKTGLQMSLQMKKKWKTGLQMSLQNFAPTKTLLFYEKHVFFCVIEAEKADTMTSTVCSEALYP